MWPSSLTSSNRTDTRFDTPDALIGPMSTVAMPETAGRTMDDAARVRDRLLFEDRIEVQVHAWQDRLYARISAQIYNTMDDVDRLAAAVLRLSL